MRKFTKLICLVLAVALVAIGLAGCGDKAETSSAADAIKIGGIGPITGAAAIYGQAV